MTGDTGGNVIFWDARSWAAVRRLHVAEPIQYLAISPDGRLLAVATQASNASTSEVQILDVASGAVTRTFSLSGGTDGLAFDGLAFDDHGTELAACCTSGSSIEVWSVGSGRKLFAAHVAGGAQSFAFSPTAPELAVGSADGKIYLWNTLRGTQTAVIAAAASNVLSLAYSPDGKLIAAGLRDGTSVLLDLASRDTLGEPWPAVTGVQPALLFGSNGDLVINYAGTATVWPTDLAAWEGFACQVAGRDITPTEWSNILPGRRYQHLCRS